MENEEVIEKKPKDEKKEEVVETEEKVKTKKNPFKGIINFVRKRIILVLVIAVVVLVGIIALLTRKGNQIEIKVKSTLEKIVEKNDLETLSIVYNVIAKQCNEGVECDKTSNDIDDFYYVVSCKGTITAGIDFSKVKIEVLKEEKKVVVEIPEATIQGIPSIGSIKFLNGDDIPASKVSEARKLCEETIIEKSELDDRLIPSAKEQAKVVLEEFYKQWVKAYDSSYVVEVR